MSLTVAGYSWRIEPFMLEFVQLNMPIKNLPKHLIDKTLMQISDVHVGDLVDQNYLIESFIAAKKFNPDIVVYTGDYVHWENEKQYDQIKKVFKHAVIGKLGTVGILGNHDYGHECIEQDVADNIAQLLRSAGIDILINDNKDIDGLNVIGIDDYWGPNFHPEMALSRYEKSKENIP